MPLKGRSADVTDIILGLSLDEGPGINIRANPTKTAWSIRRRKQSPNTTTMDEIRTPSGFVRSRRQPTKHFKPVRPQFRTINGNDSSEDAGTQKKWHR